MATIGAPLCLTGSADGTSLWACSWQRSSPQPAVSLGVPATCSTRRRRRAATAASFPAADEDYFRDMDGGVPLTPRGDQGPQHVDRLDRRQRPLLGHDLGQHASARFDLLKTLSSHPDADGTAATTAGSISGWSTSRASQADRSRPEPLRPVARRRATRLPARSVRERAEVSRRRRSARAARRPCRSAPTTASHRHRRPAAVPEPGLRRAGAQALGLRALLHRSRATTTTGPGAGRTASACRAASATSGRTR